ncbi:MAG: o-succinylbenzoate--CoA ligase [Galactobacter sp.]
MLNHGLGSWLTRRLVKSGSKPAIIAGERTLTYADLEEAASRAAAAFADAGVGPGDRVAYLGENSPEFVEVLFAAGRIGAVTVPLNTRLAPGELAYQLDDAGVSVLVYDDSLAGAAVPAAATAETDVATWDLDELHARSAAVGRFDEDVRVGLDDLAVILYTSGTTGRPKGAMLTHGNLTSNCFNVLIDYDVASTDVALMISPMFHVASLGMGVLPTLLKGATLVVETRFVPSQVLQLVQKFKVTTLSGVPTTFQMLMEDPAWDTADLSSLRNLTCGGSAMPKYVIDAYAEKGVGFTMNYGMTETSPGATSTPLEFALEKIGASGLPQFFVDVKIVEPGGDELPAGQVGEILVQGPNVIKEYWNRPDAASSFEAEGWFHTGDLGRLDEDGFLFVTDRLKDMFVSGGENVYPAEVEAVLSGHPDLAAVSVIGVPHPKWGEAPHAFVVPRGSAEITAETIMEFLDGKLARYKIPRTLTVVEDLPRTASGKIRKNLLRDSLA